MTALLIHNCMALIPDAENGLPALRQNLNILIEKDKIAALRPGDAKTPQQADRVIDARGMLAMPGLINTHAHTPMGIFRGLAEDVTIERWFNEFMWPLESNLTAEDVYWGMLLGLVEMIEGGVTTVADHYFFMDQAGEAVAQAGTRAVLGWAVFGSSGYKALDAAADFVTRWQGKAEGRITTLMAPHAPYTCDDDFLRAAVAHAKNLGVGIHIHAAETLGQTAASQQKRGLTPIQVLAKTGVFEVPTIIAHGCGILPEDIALMKTASAPIGVAHAPKTYLKLGMGLTPILPLQQAGIPVGLATDGPVSNNTLDIFESLRLMAMLQKHEARNPEVMTIPQALDIATRGSAAVLGMADKIGQLAPGYLADIILVDMGGAHHQPLHRPLASLVYNTRASDVQTVIVNGKIIMQDRRLLTLNKAEIIRRVGQNMARLSRRVPENRIQLYQP